MASYTPNLNLYKPDDSDDYEDFREKFNENMEKLDQGGNANQNIAEAYDDTATYAVGDYVIYNGLLYKCDTAVSSAETFDPTKWTHVVVTDEMGSGGGGSGDTVTWNQIQQSGTKIAEISINGTSQDVYAPQGGGSGSLDAIETTSNTYALLPQADKEDPTKIYFLNNTQSSVVDTPINQSTFVLKVENQSQMSVAVTNGKLVSVYNYGSSIGACAFEPNAISETASKIKFKFTTLGSYDTAQSHAITIGVKANYQSSNWIFSTDADWLVKKVYDTRNTSVDDYIDISGITTPCYLMICFHGWTVTFDEFLVEDVSVPTGDTEIRYKDVPYGNNGGESGGNYYLNTLYSTEEKKIGYWTDGKPLYQKTVVLSNISYDSNWHSYAHGISNIDEIADIKGVFANSTESFEINSFRPTTTQGLLVGADSTNIRYMNNWQNDATRNIAVTLQYTKTTDAPEPNPQTGGVIYLPTIYSEEERQVGVWRDNKPLYQKTLVINNLNLNTSGTAVDITSLGVDMCCPVYEGSYYIVSGVERGFARLEYQQPNEVYLYPAVNRTGTTSFITLQYTKTTDVAGSGDWTPSGARAVHYSTNEQVVGTWIDGKPLYQKAFTGLSQPTNGNNWVTINGVIIPNIGEVISLNAFSVGGSGNMIKVALAEYSRNNNGDGVQVSVVSSSFNRTINTAVVQYIKTTD